MYLFIILCRLTFLSEEQFNMSYTSRFLLCRLFSLAAILRNRCSASSFLPPANTGMGGGNMIDMVFALFVFTDVCVFEVDTTFKSMLLLLLLLLFWLLLMLAKSSNLRIISLPLYMQSIDIRF